MIEVICNDRLGKKVRVKCNEDDTIGNTALKCVSLITRLMIKVIVCIYIYRRFKETHSSSNRHTTRENKNTKMVYCFQRPCHIRRL